MQEGKLSQEAAIAYAEKFNVVPSKNISMDRSLSLSKTKEVFNFSVYKWNKVRTVQRLILQVQFCTNSMVMLSLSFLTMLFPKSAYSVGCLDKFPSPSPE